MKIEPKIIVENVRFGVNTYKQSSEAKGKHIKLKSRICELDNEWKIPKNEIVL